VSGILSAIRLSCASVFAVILFLFSPSLLAAPWLPVQQWLARKRGAERIPLLRDGGVAVEYVNIKYLAVWFSMTPF
jgi:hypothetical protein